MSTSDEYANEPQIPWFVSRAKIILSFLAVKTLFFIKTCNFLIYLFVRTDAYVFSGEYSFCMTSLGYWQKIMFWAHTQSWISIYVCSHSLLHNNSFHLYCIVPKKGLCTHRSICLIFPTTDFFLQKWGSRRIRSGSYQIQTIGFPVFLRIKTIPLGIDNNETSD